MHAAREYDARARLRAQRLNKAVKLEEVAAVTVGKEKDKKKDPRAKPKAKPKAKSRGPSDDE